MKNRKWKYILPIGLLALVGIIAAVPKEKTNADYIAADIFQANTSNTNMVFQLYEDGPTGDYYYQTSGRHHSSPKVHHTAGLEFSKIRDEFVTENGWNPKKWKYPTSQNGNTSIDPHAYCTLADGRVGRVSVVIARYNDPGVYCYSQVLSNGYELGTWKINYDSLWARIRQAQPAWYEELQEKISAGQEYYFGVDAVKVIIQPYDDSLSGYDNYMYHGSGQLIVDQYGYPSYIGNESGLFTWLNWDTDPEWDYLIDNYYNKYFRGNHNPVDTPEVEEPVIITGDKITLTKSEDPSGGSNIGKGTGTNQSQDAFSSPRVYTYNESSEFNVGVGIPTTESYNNHIDVTSWYGSVEVTKRGGEV